MNTSAIEQNVIAGPSIAARIARLDWAAVQTSLESRGFAVLKNMLSVQSAATIVESYTDSALFRSRVVMQRHNYGRGEYKYFTYPLLRPVQQLRVGLYARLVGIANGWNEAMDISVRYPESHAEFLDRCHQAGQTKPTPLVLRYGPDDYNCLHQDLYGEHVFPLQAAFLLSRPQIGFTGGELVLTEQRPRMQSRVEVVPLDQGDGVIFAVNHRPVRGARGFYRVNMRHGVSRLLSGERFTLGVIFHDAR